MPGHDPTRKRTEKQLLNGTCGFQGTFLAVQYLRSHIDRGPASTSPATVQALFHQIRSPRFDKKKQVYFLLGEAADALIALSLSADTPTCIRILSALQQILAQASGARARAVGNAVGRLPVAFTLPPVELPTPLPPVTIPLRDLIRAMGTPGSEPIRWLGRSLVVPLQDRKVGVIKFANSRDNIPELVREHFWQDQLMQIRSVHQQKGQIPSPLVLDGSGLFRIPDPLPAGHPEGLYQGICIAYTAAPLYFEYPNERVDDRSWPGICQAFFAAAGTLGQLTASGLFHTALIPLFHNRVQQDRRNDRGRYLWEHGGRLDQWLDSCRFPNFALSGLRDFEHLEPAESSKDLRHYIGEHLLSFILVMGSCFRRQAPDRRGWDAQHKPVDTRDLFRPQLFCELITGVCQRYFEAFSHAPLPGGLKDKIPVLVKDLVQAMGIDRDMEETLRIQDQQNMTPDTYARFLHSRGISPAPSRGKTDIVVHSGPHLGGFNQQISVPGLVDFLYNFSSLCVSYCFARQNKLKA